MDLAESYRHKPDDYFSGARHDFIRELPQSTTSSILEIGCGSGGTGALALAEGKCARYVGIELFPDAAARAREKLTTVIEGDVEVMQLDLEPSSFDVLIMSEVLEHLKEPWAVLAKIAPLLKPGAIVFASSPNVSHYKVIKHLLNGRFDLADKGVMDRTHMRWFTPATYAEMFERQGFAVEKVWPHPTVSTLKRTLMAISLGHGHLFYKQICIRAVRRPSVATVS